MIDRTSTKVLANGAIRYAVYDEAGNFLRYEYMKLDDEPTQEGTLFCKETILQDSTAGALGLTSSAVPNDAFLALYIGVGKYGYAIHLAFADGSPVKNKEIGGVTSVTGGTISTDENGYALGVSTTATPTITVNFSDYLDVNNISIQLQSTSKITTVHITATNKAATSITVASSGIKKFSPMVLDFDVALIGAGGGGGGGGYSWKGGGGGGYVTNSFNLTYYGSMTISIGAGGIAETDSGTGGNTTISELSLVASGGSNGIGASGGNGNGDGGNGMSGSGLPGRSRTVTPFNDPSIQCSGGGGGGTNVASAALGGSDYGGNGGGYTTPASQSGKGYGGGGGGGAYQGSSSNGYQGAVMFRWRYKAV